MIDYPYVKVIDKLKKFLSHIQTAGVPPSISKTYLNSAGYKSSNDVRILNVLRFLDFIDSSNIPTETYKKFRNKAQAPTVLGDAIRQGYAELFDMYPNADQQDTEALRNFFSSHTEAGEQVLTAMVSTLKALCAEAKFEVSGAVAPTIAEKAEVAKPKPSIAAPKTLDTRSLTINIQLTLPETTNIDVYKEIFKAMRQYLIESSE